MSQQAVTDFLNSATSNPGLLAQIANAGNGVSPAEAGNVIAALGAEAGFTFTGADALAVREVALARIGVAPASEEDAILDGVRGGMANPYLDAQIGTFRDTVGITPGLPSGTGVFTDLVIGAAQGDLAGGAIDAANSYEETRSTVQEFFSSIFRGW